MYCWICLVINKQWEYFSTSCRPHFLKNQTYFPSMGQHAGIEKNEQLDQPQQRTTSVETNSYYLCCRIFPQFWMNLPVSPQISGNICRKPVFFQGSCKFSLKPIHWELLPFHRQRRGVEAMSPMGQAMAMEHDHIYPLVMTKIAMENGHRISEFSHWY